MTEPTGDPSFTQDPNLVTNSDNLSLEEKETTLIINTEVLDSAPKRRQVNDSPDDSPDTLVTQVVQTVSLVHYVNTDGVTRATSTHYANPQTVLVNPASGEIVRPVDNEPRGTAAPPAPPAAADISESPEAPEPTSADNPQTPGAPEPSVPAPPDDTTVSPEAPEASTRALPISSGIPDLGFPPAAVEPLHSDLPNTTSDLPVLPSGDIIPEPSYTELPLESSLSDDLSTSLELPSAFPTLTPVHPLPGVFQNNTNFNRTALVPPFSIASTTLLPSSSSSSLSSSASSSSSSSSTSATRTSTGLSVVTTTSGSTPGGGGGGGGGAGLPEADVATSNGDDGPTPTGTLVGSVVGSVAGAALIVFLVMAILRWRKQKSGRVRLGDDLDDGARGLGAAGDPSGSGGGGGGMAQRSLPFAVPAVLASMSSFNKNRPSSGDAQSAEQGFYRVSGKRLPPVIQFGGDGFSDPRQSTISGASSGHRDSHMLGFEQGAAPRLMLGQPMRPVSGIPVMRSGPGRTPVAEQNPFADPPTQPRGLDPDAIGRSLTAQDMSRGSSSKFTEVL